MIQKFPRVLVPALAWCLLIVSAAHAQSSGLWTEISDNSLQQRGVERDIVPSAYRTFRLDKSSMLSLLDRAPEETSAATQSTITIPMPDGSLGRFRFEHSLVVEPGLLAKYPELGRTYRATGIDDPTATARFDFLPAGFHAIVLSSQGTVMVDPYMRGDTSNYIVYSKDAAQRTSDFSCEFDNQQAVDDISTPKEPAKFEFIPGAVPETVPETSSGSQLRTYRLALGATNEYAVAVGGNTIAGTLAAQVLIMNRVNGVYERDLAIHMNIVANNNLIVYAGDQMCGTIPAACTSATDPYSNTMATTLLTENQTNLDAVIGSANYDIGHVFSTGGGGVASVNVPCRAGQKARGETGLTNPVGDAFAIDYVAHEMGHQWGGLHTFNGSVSNCAGGNRSGSAAYEPGSGVTIMAYAGICGNQNLAAHSIDTFHVKSLEQIIAYSQTGTGNTCAVTTASANTPPSVSVLGGTSFNIPKQTPFALTASGSDADGDTVTYDWQEYDLGAATTEVPNSDATLGAMPIFRPYLPTVSETHYFPTLDYVRNNSNVPPSTYNGTLLTGELLPSIARTMTFQVVARDNHALAGGVSTATASVVVDGASGPFAVTAPNTAGTWAANSTQTVTWNVANTGAGTTVNAANVKISLSTDGGLTFPITLLASTSNDGAKAITVPNVVTSAARIKVEAVGNIFFDMSDANFTISASSPLAPKRFDFDGDGKADPAVYRGGAWYMLQSQAGFSGVNFGLATDKTVAADYDGDGKTDVAVFRDGVWYVLRSQLGLYVANFGSAGDIPVAGDYTGDGKADLTVFRSGVWYTQNIATNAVTIQQFGLAGDVPVVGDWDNDGKQDIGIFRNGTWYVNGSTQGLIGVNFGLAGDSPVPADYDGDGKTDFAVFRGGVWYILQSTAGFTAYSFGSVGDIPVPADYDGDGKADAAIYRNGSWYELQSSAGTSIFNFGLSGDKPIPAQANQ